MVALLVGNLFAFARHTVTQVLLALGLHDAEWTASYRLFSRSRLDEAILNRCLICTTLKRYLVHESYLIEDRRETATTHQSDVLREATRSCWCWSGKRHGRTGSGVPPASGES
nr:transposase [Chloroflexus sp.]